jgi:hypothetical protein
MEEFTGLRADPQQEWVAWVVVVVLAVDLREERRQRSIVSDHDEQARPAGGNFVAAHEFLL